MKLKKNINKIYHFFPKVGFAYGFFESENYKTFYI
jgi:hypothetical protein